MTINDIFQAVEEGKLDEIKALYQSSASLFSHYLQDQQGNTPLHIAVIRNDTEMAGWILQNIPPAINRATKHKVLNTWKTSGASWSGSVNKEGYTPLDLAVKNSHFELINLLGKVGYRFNLSQYVQKGIDNIKLIDWALQEGLYTLDFSNPQNNLLSDAMKGCAPNTIKYLTDIIDKKEGSITPECYKIWLSQALEDFKWYEYINRYNPKRFITLEGTTRTILLGEKESDAQYKRIQELDKCSKERIIEWTKDKLEQDDIGDIILKAIKQDQLNLIRYFIENREYKIVFTGNSKEDFLYQSILNKKEDISDYLRKIIDNGQVEVEPNCYLLCFGWAIQNPDPDIEIWCKSKIDAIDAVKVIEASSLLPIATRYGRADIVQYLLEETRCKICFEDSVIWSPIYWATDKRDAGLLNYLKNKIDSGRIEVNSSYYLSLMRLCIMASKTFILPSDKDIPSWYEERVKNWCKEKLVGVDLESEKVLDLLMSIIEDPTKEEFIEGLIGGIRSKIHIRCAGNDCVTRLIGKPDSSSLLNYFKEQADEGKITVEPIRYLNWLIKAVKSSDSSMEEWCKEKIKKINFPPESLGRYEVREYLTTIIKKDTDYEEYVCNQFNLSFFDLIKYLVKGHNPETLSCLKWKIENMGLEVTTRYIKEIERIDSNFAKWLSDYQNLRADNRLSEFSGENDGLSSVNSLDALGHCKSDAANSDVI